MNLLSPDVVIPVAIVLAAIAVIAIRKYKARTAAGPASAPSPTLASRLDALEASLKAHFEKTTSAAAESIKTRVATVGNVVVEKLGTEKPAVAGPAKPQATHVANDSATAASAPSSAPAAASAASAAPASSAAVDSPPATAAPAATPAASAPSAGGSGAPQADPAAEASDQFYRAAIAAKAAQQSNELYTGPVAAASLADEDWKFLWWATINPATPKMHNWEYTVLSGTRAEIQSHLAPYGINPGLMRKFDATKYNGVLRGYYDAAVKA